MYNIILVALGGVVGSLSRYFISKMFSHLIIFNIPIVIILINIIGSFLMGIVFQYSQENANENIKHFVSLGVLGSFTTFSTFSLEAYNLFTQDKLTEAIIYILASVVLSLLALYLGIILIKK